MCYNRGNRAVHLKFWVKAGATSSMSFRWVVIFGVYPLGKGRWEKNERCLPGCIILHFGIFALLLRSGFWYVAWSICVFGINAADGGFARRYAGENDFNRDADFSLSSAFGVGYHGCDCVFHGCVFRDTDFVCVSFNQWSCRLPQKDLLVRSSLSYNAYV